LRAPQRRGRPDRAARSSRRTIRNRFNGLLRTRLAAIEAPAAIALAGCEDALYVVEVGTDAEEDELVERRPGEAVERSRRLELVPPWARETFLDVDAVGSTVVLVVDRRPPLLVSHDGGATWAERGAGVGRARAVAVGENPDDVLLATRNRLWVSVDGGVFWRSVGVELPEIVDVSWA
jgi:hypothetical protein